MSALSEKFDLWAFQINNRRYLVLPGAQRYHPARSSWVGSQTRLVETIPGLDGLHIGRSLFDQISLASPYSVTAVSPFSSPTSGATTLYPLRFIVSPLSTSASTSAESSEPITTHFAIPPPIFQQGRDAESIAKPDADMNRQCMSGPSWPLHYCLRNKRT